MFPVPSIVHVNDGVPSRNTHIHTVSKGLSTYDYIVLHREEDTRNGGGLESGFHGRCAFLRRKVASWSLVLSLAVPSGENDLAQ